MGIEQISNNLRTDIEQVSNKTVCAAGRAILSRRLRDGVFLMHADGHRKNMRSLRHLLDRNRADLQRGAG
jgi:hypothetical protein